MAQCTLIDEPTVPLDALMALGSDARVEVIDGEIVYMSPVGIRHQLIGGNIFNLWYAFVTQNQLGFVFFDGLIYLLHRSGKRLRGSLVPDVSFVAKADFPKDWDIDRPFPGAPTIAVEIVSPNDEPERLIRRVRMYLDAGTEAVWAVYPETREVHIYTADGAIQRYFDDMTIDMGAFMPGLTIPLPAIFAMPELE
jgi:Uma2 family endonuclease